MSAPRRRAAAIALGLGLVLTPALSGCMPSVDDLVGGLVQQGIEEGLEGLAGVDYAEGSLPAGFPGEVPLIEGELVGGVGATVEEGQQGWIVNITTDRSIQDIAAQLEGAGFPASADLSGTDLGVEGVFAAENDRFAVFVVVVDDGGTRSATYTVSTK